MTACQKSAARTGRRDSTSAACHRRSNRSSKKSGEWDEYQGRIEAVDSVEVRARVNGYLDSVNFKDGDEVKQGDLLFVIDPRPYQAELDRAEAELLQAQTRFELASNDVARAVRLLKAKAISEEQADSRAKAEREAAAAIQSSLASVEVAKLNMTYTHVTAPISGRIGRKMITAGNLVNGDQGQSTLLASIVSMDPIYCDFDVDEGAILKYQQLARDGKDDSLNGGNGALRRSNWATNPVSRTRDSLDFVDNRLDPEKPARFASAATFPNPDRVFKQPIFARARVPGIV